ncbi:MAG TPA: hypothetical protein VGE40_04610 [Bacilli bacterium]
MAKYSFICMLFILVYLFVYNMISVLIHKNRIRNRLVYYQQTNLSYSFAGFVTQTKYRFLVRHISDMLEAISFPVKINSFFLLALILILSGILIGSFVFQSPKGVLVLSFIFGSAPYLVLRMKVTGLQMKTRIDFLPAVEIFYEHYVMSGHKNIISILKGAVLGNRIWYPIKPIFEQLQRNLSTNREVDDCLRIFALSLGHSWADYFTSIIRFGLIEGVDITLNLKQLISDMRKAQRANQVERNRLLEIRLANFSSIIFLIIFLGINFKINFHNSYYYYLVDHSGRSMLLDGVLFIFLSFLMGVYLSVRRM